MTTRTALLAGIAAAALGLQPLTAWSQAETPAAAPAAPAPYTPPAATAPDAPAPATPAPAAPAAAEKPAAATAPAPDAAAPATAPAAASSVTPVPDATAVSPADDEVLTAVQSLPTLIEDVQIVGPWTDGDKNGVWRTAMVQSGPAEKEIYRFFIQQIDKSAGATSVLSTTEIKEITTVNGAIVGYRADEPSEDEPSGLTLFFDIVPSDGEIAETYELHYFKDQPYTFGPATN
ncbi:hypothetical protein Sa4125_20690 [Aureimonas sp. SA4125]|uniref:hypothetical protein n=1 Tax=Aureimonas sp. SA4125 TaxID=2826993 RepID=UPI001CC337B0|nr:hypothetical protein [Aureimonas sp. SA4125]BDA84527.1 hypothetical protein Sa4125_20690 [Aureimonas sp. SA4125]